MNIRPIDAKILLPKSTEVSQMIYAEQQKENVLKNVLAQKNQNRVDENMKRVYQKDNVSDVRINEKQKEENKRGKQNKKGDSSKGFDIRI